MIGRWIALIVVLAAWASPAAAQDGRWWRAESANFIVYGDRNERQVRSAAQSLEDFHLVLRTITDARTPAVSENKLEVYLVRGAVALRQASPAMGDNIGGFYIAGAEQIAAFVRYDDRVGLHHNTILFHEYAHHFMLHYFPHAYPRWYVEGFAEYVSTTEIRGREAHVGLASSYRSDSLLYGGSMRIEYLLAPERAPDNADLSGFYANSWAAARFVFHNAERMRGMNRYVARLGDGADPLEAFEESFGISPAAFDRELRAARGGRVMVGVYQLGPANADISVTRLPSAADEVWLYLARLRTSRRDVSDRDAAEIERQAMRNAGHPISHLVLARLAIRRDDSAKARTHIDALLTANEDDSEARYLRATLILSDAADKTSAEIRNAVDDARRELARVFRTDPNHYPTLYLYASTFAGGHARMDEQSLNVLARALELAPQADAIRLTLARELIRAEFYDVAVEVLRPLIYAPHGGRAAAQARDFFTAAQERRQPSQEAEPEESEGENAD